jgi:hypothetical protein
MGHSKPGKTLILLKLEPRGASFSGIQAAQFPEKPKARQMI